MFRYFIEKEPKVNDKTKQILKNRLLSKRKYQPFHLDCDYTRKKLCYCTQHAISELTNDQREQIWKTF